MITMTTPAIKPWYREPWPWLLMAGPLIVVIAAIYTAWLAISTADGLVADDYYKQGLAAGQTLARSDKARAIALVAKLRIDSEGVSVQLSGRAEAGYQQPAAVRITLSHPTRAGVDQVQLLQWDGQGFIGKLHVPSSGHWLVLLEDEAKSWRLMAGVQLPASGEIVIGGDPSPADNS